VIDDGELAGGNPSRTPIIHAGQADVDGFPLGVLDELQMIGRARFPSGTTSSVRYGSRVSRAET